MDMGHSAKIVFFGNERLATATSTTAPTLRALVAAGYMIEAVIANYVDPLSRQKRDLEIGPIAQSHKIPVILPGKTIPLAQKLAKHPADVAVLVAFGQMIPPEVIDLFPKGIINIHPSLLPQLRGSTPIESAILEGLDKTGVSLMQVSPRMDAGPIYAQQNLTLKGHEAKFELAKRLGDLGASLLVQYLPAILEGSLQPKPQQESAASYTRQISKADGRIDWTKPAEILEREIRAYAGWPGSQTTLADKEVVVTAAKVVPESGKPGDIMDNEGNLGVFCGQNALIIERLKPAGKQEMSGADFKRGYLK